MLLICKCVHSSWYAELNFPLVLQADVWDVDGTGMQTVPDFQLSKKIRKVQLLHARA